MSETSPPDATTSPTSTDSSRPGSADLERTCWVCFTTDQDDPTMKWVKPCRCRGTTKWVHQHCLQRWVDEKQKGNTSAKVVCAVCATEYIIIYPSPGVVLYVLELADSFIYRTCPILGGVLLIGSVYWTAVTYGALTTMQILGHKEGLNAMERADPVMLLIGLPTIPIMLILVKMIRWEEYLLKLWLKHSAKIPLLQSLYPSDIPAWRLSLSAETQQPFSVTRILCGALIYPTIATAVGKLLFPNVGSNFHRSMLGFISFGLVKGLLKLYYNHQKYIRSCRRRILDFKEESHTASQTQ